MHIHARSYAHPKLGGSEFCQAEQGFSIVFSSILKRKWLPYGDFERSEASMWLPYEDFERSEASKWLPYGDSERYEASK